MKMILFASVAVLALASCANTVQPATDGAGAPPCSWFARSLDNLASYPAACPYRQEPSYWNPTGEVVRGPHGEISLFGVHSGGSR